MSIIVQGLLSPLLITQGFTAAQIQSYPTYPDPFAGSIAVSGPDAFGGSVVTTGNNPDPFGGSVQYKRTTS